MVRQPRRGTIIQYSGRFLTEPMPLGDEYGFGGLGFLPLVLYNAVFKFLNHSTLTESFF